MTREEINKATRELMSESMKIARQARLSDEQKTVELQKEIRRERRNKPLKLWN